MSLADSDRAAFLHFARHHSHATGDEVWQVASHCLTCWQQLRTARYRTPGEGLLTMYVDPAEGHDDFLMSLALCCEAIRSWSIPITEAHIIKPRLHYQHESPY